MAAYKSNGGGVVTKEDEVVEFFEKVTSEQISKNPVKTYENLLVLAAGNFSLNEVKISAASVAKKMDILALEGAVELLGAMGKFKAEIIKSAGLDEPLSKLQPIAANNNGIAEIMKGELKAKKTEKLAGGSEQRNIPAQVSEPSKGASR